MKQLKYSLPSILSNLTKIESFIDKMIDEFQIPSSLQGRISLAVIEAVNNSILHGNKQNPEKTIAILAKKYRDRITVIVKDEGEGFDCTDIPDPTAPGKGLYLMSSLSDELTFHSSGSKVVMSFLLDKQFHPWRGICVVAIILITVWGLLFWLKCREDDIREKKYRQYMEECGRTTEDNMTESAYEYCPV